MRKFQAFNPVTDAWTLFNQYADGHTQIVKVKQREPQVPFQGVPRRR